MAIVTISTELGAGGPEIGLALAERVGYRYRDRDVISEAARRYGLTEAKLARFDEKKPSLFERVDAEGRLYVAGTRAVLLEFAQADEVVLMGRGGQWLLRHIPHAIHVRVTAPFEVRVARVTQSLQRETGKTPSQPAVVDMVRRDDAGRAGRLRYLYELDIRDPALYDLVINTTQFTVSAATDLLAGLVRRPEFATTEAGRRIVVDRRLASLVEVALARDPETRRRRINVEAVDGVVRLEATADLDRAAKIAHEVPGVKEVTTVTVEVLPPVVM